VVAGALAWRIGDLIVIWAARASVPSPPPAAGAAGTVGPIVGAKAYLIALMTSSVTISPMLTALSDPIRPSSASTVRRSGWLSPIIDAARLAHSLVR
jgi:hypothetical protein